MLRNQHAKFYARVGILLIITLIPFAFYVANRNDVLSSKPRSYKKYVVQPKSKMQASLLTISSRSITKVLFANPRRRLEKHDGPVYSFGSGNEEIKLAVVLCGERLNQTLVTLKSAVIFSKTVLHFIIIVDESNKEHLKNKLLEWPDSVLDKLSFEIHPIQFPSGREGDEWKKLFKLCACQRLFLPSLLHHIDSLLYVDTDVLFLRPVEDLWQYFHKMNDSHIAALCPEHEDFATGWYNRFARHPFYEPLGVNSGVMLMNLTRMRAFQWEKYLPPIMKEYKLNIVWGDQDIINIIFHFHPEKLYIIPCEWNYRPDHCMYSSVCKSAEKNGIAVIHGNRGVFQNSKQPSFKAVYKAMSEYNLCSNFESGFIKPVKEFLKESENTNCGKHLSSIFSSINTISSNSQKTR